VVASRVLGPTDRGHLALLTLLPVIFCELGGLGVPAALAYHIARGRGTRDGWCMRAAFLACAQISVWTSAHWLVLSFLLKPDDPLWTAARFTIPVTAAALVSQYCLAVHQGERRLTVFNFVRLMPSLSYASLLCLSVATMSLGLKQVSAIWCGAYLVSAGVAIASVVATAQRISGVRADSPSCAALLSFGIRGVLGVSSPLQSLRVDQAFIGLTMPAAALGQYVVALSVTNLPGLVASSIGAVAFPTIAATGNSRQQRDQVWVFLRKALIACGALTAALLATTPFLIPTFFGPQFADAVPIARILLFGALFQSVRRVLADSLRGAGLPEWSTYAELVAWLVLAVTAMAFTHSMGVAGLALALTVSSGCGLLTLGIPLLAIRRRPGAMAVDTPDATRMPDDVCA
jgi:O-antigen/teichoic acid export membrane protein